ncbi:hypothetical protein [Noviherbaspirillum malthae]|uniref:hypothetical protein n=1 Tax=Noviherbaspirillum malthae TaxID=1260987 RepID=UPI00188FBA04|nr:hypothetical protein [Noviherbaspirillum malthae]
MNSGDDLYFVLSSQGAGSNNTFLRRHPQAAKQALSPRPAYALPKLRLETDVMFRSYCITLLDAQMLVFAEGILLATFGEDVETSLFPTVTLFLNQG